MHIVNLDNHTMYIYLAVLILLKVALQCEMRNISLNLYIYRCFFVHYMTLLTTK